jgi:hypothetical protein
MKTDIWVRGNPIESGNNFRIPYIKMFIFVISPEGV